MAPGDATSDPAWRVKRMDGGAAPGGEAGAGSSAGGSRGRLIEADTPYVLTPGPSPCCCQARGKMEESQRKLREVLSDDRAVLAL